MNDAIKRCLGPGDFIRIRKAHQISPVDSLVFGEVLGAVREDQLRCRMYCSMTTAILTKFTLQPIITSFFPVAARTVNTEVVATNIIEDLTRDAVEDIVFILPIQEFESGNVFVTGATNVYFVRFIMDQAQSSITNFSSTNFFGYHFIQPLTVRIFGALNTLAYTIKKLMYHRQINKIINALDKLLNYAPYNQFLWGNHEVFPLTRPLEDWPDLRLYKLAFRNRQ